MKVKDFIELCNREFLDVDVYDNVCEELGIAYCGDSIELTTEGKEHFKEALEFDIDYDADYSTAIVDIDDVEGVWQKKLRKAKEFFYAAAGYCADSDYQKWFREIEE